ncbi:MAG TPA: alpha/beta fold hydrolase [Candidatus Elarobacter sp.]|nr:alpha/beta fold hydrolase [Candidatus Elarobacter sp.]
MRRTRLAALAVSAAVLIGSSPVPYSAPPSGALHLSPCIEGRQHIPALCGWFSVYEDRAARGGRFLSLRLVVLKARVSSGRAVALVPGGPGQSAVSLAPFVADGRLARELIALRDRYDILFVDARGMGESQPFACDLAPATRPEAYFRELWPAALVSACWRRTVRTRDPNLYDTNNAVDDLDDVRRALGYRSIVLDGGSYGTFFAFVYLRRHPEHVQSAVLDGVYAPRFIPLPGAPHAAQATLDDLVARCAADAMCHGRFPQFGSHFAALLKRFEAGPLHVPLQRGKRRIVVPLSKEVFVDQFRQMLDSPGNAAYLPAIVEAGWRGDYGPIADMVDSVSQSLAHGLDWGAFFSYTCAEEIPFVSDREIDVAARRSFAGELRVRAQQRACRRWPVRPMPPAFNQPVRSAVPVLMIAGTDDPATPARDARAQLPYLSRGALVLVRGAGHVTETRCTDALKIQFIRTRSARAAEASRCRTTFTAPPFAMHP